MDVATARLISSLHKQDLAELEQSGVDDVYEGALDALKEELDAWDTFQADQAMAISMAQAVFADDVALNNLRAEEEAALRDRDIACRLGNVAVEPQTPNHNHEASLDKSFWRYASLNGSFEDLPLKMDHLRVESDNGYEDGEPSSSKAKGKGRMKNIPTRPKELPCVVCQQTSHFFDILTVPCGHDYCRGCLIELYTVALRDESLFPIRCCSQEIPFEDASVFLPKHLGQSFLKKAEEYQTRDRTYCSLRLCGKFIPTKEIVDEVVECPDCGSRTCTICKDEDHDGDCPGDLSLQVALDAAATNGWQRCYSCRRLVELSQGCHHITCLCKAEFCYVCAAPWKTCTCDAWDERLLENRAVQVAARRQPQEPPADYGGIEGIGFQYGNAVADPVPALEEEEPQDAIAAPAGVVHEDPLEFHNFVEALDAYVPRPAHINRIMDNLRVDHECKHQGWNYLAGPRQCEECFHNLPRYIFECKQCKILACWRCRRNRL